MTDAPANGYGQRAIKAAAWLTGLRAGNRILAVLRLVFIADLLGPEQMGLFGVAVVVLATMDILSELGINTALIQRRGDIQPFLGTAWSVQATRGFLVGTLLILLAPFIAAWFKSPEAVPVIRLLALSPILRGLRSAGTVYFDRELRIKQLTVFELGATFIDVVLSIVLVLILRDIYALVWARLAGMAYMVVASYLMTRQPRPELSLEKLREILGFGIWVFVSGLMAFVLVRGGDFAVGRLRPTEELGIYTIATQLAIMPIREITQVIQRVTLPTYSRLQDDRDRLARAFLRSFLVITIIVVGAMMLVIVLAQDAVNAFMKPAWQPVGPLMQTLAVWGGCRSLGAINSSLFMAVGRPRLASYYQFLMLVMFAVLVYPVTKHGGLPLLGFTLAVIGVTAQAFRYRLTAELLGVTQGALFARALAPVGAAVVGGLGAWGVATLLPDASWLIRLPALALVSAALYSGVLLAVDRASSLDIVMTCMELVPRRFRPQAAP